MRLTGKKALVTGAGGGIGRATALKFAAEGAAVICADLNAATAEDTAHLITTTGGTAVTAIGDLSQPESCEAVFTTGAAALGGIDILFNNAGIVRGDDTGPIETPLSVWDLTIAVNLTAVFLACKFGCPTCWPPDAARWSTTPRSSPSPARPIRRSPIPPPRAACWR
jgi:NAD(P)-dependent dehydrogenase (short-subunit alcohol dehydrogenase family)